MKRENIQKYRDNKNERHEKDNLEQIRSEPK